MQRRMVDTARQSDRRLWEDLAARAVGVPVPYRPAPGIAVYHIRVDDYVVMAAEVRALRQVMWVGLRLGEAGEQQGVGGRDLLVKPVEGRSPRTRRRQARV